jgi:hypothetical protein
MEELLMENQSLKQTVDSLSLKLMALERVSIFNFLIYL